MSRRKGADRDIQRNFFKEAAPGGVDLGLAIVERIHDEPDARRPVVSQNRNANLHADQALLLEAQTGLDGEPAERPGVLDVTRPGTAYRWQRWGWSSCRASNIQHDGRSPGESDSYCARERRAVDRLAGGSAQFRQVGQREGRAGVLINVVIHVVVELVAVGNAVAAQETEDVRAGNRHLVDLRLAGLIESRRRHR